MNFFGTNRQFLTHSHFIGLLNKLCRGSRMEALVFLSYIFDGFMGALTLIFPEKSVFTHFWFFPGKERSSHHFDMCFEIEISPPLLLSILSQFYPYLCKLTLQISSGAIHEYTSLF